MAIKKVKRPVNKKQSAVSTRQSVNSKKSGARSLATASLRREAAKQKRKSGARSQESVGSTPETKLARYAPGEFALRQRTLPHRRFVDFPLVKGKIADKVELFTTTNSHSLTIDFQDRTSLHLDIEPGFTINAEFMRTEKGELETLAEWPPIHVPAQEP